MTGLAIRHLHQRLRLRDRADEARVRRLLATLLEGALEPALARHARVDRAEWCIRRLVLPPMHIDLGAPDGEIVERLADAWAAAVVGRFDAADAAPDLVRYGSRAQALADLAAAAPAGDLRRAWAWRQLGWWSADAALTRSDAAGLVLRALAAEPRDAPVALATLAASPPAFARWLRASSGEGLRRVAVAVLQAAGGAPSALATRSASPPAAAAQAHGARVLARSALARATSACPPLPCREARVGLAVLAIAEAEPALLLAPAGVLAQVVDAIAQAWAEAPADSGAAQPLAQAPPAPAGTRALPGARPDAGTDPMPAAGAPQHSLRAAASAPPAVHRPGMSPPGLVPALPATPEAAQTEVPPATPRAEALTAWGGLLFLLNLAGALRWPRRLLDDPVLAPRGLRWGLHALALDLLPLAGDDPAALAFAGLRPGAPSPQQDEPPTSEAEAAALRALRVELLAALRSRLRAEEPDDARLLAEVCRRRAQVQADPGWIELHFSLADVRTGIRGAGLDLDPGWLPWLGAVIRFAYE